MCWEFNYNPTIVRCLSRSLSIWIFTWQLKLLGLLPSSTQLAAVLIAGKLNNFPRQATINQQTVVGSTGSVLYLVFTDYSTLTSTTSSLTWHKRLAGCPLHIWKHTTHPRQKYARIKCRDGIINGYRLNKKSFPNQCDTSEIFQVELVQTLQTLSPNYFWTT